MTEQGLFFNVVRHPDAENPEARVQVSAGTLQRVGNQQEGIGDILMYFPTLEAGESPVAGYLSYPERAQLVFSGTLQEMRSLWMTTGTKAQFLKDPRFELTRL